MEKQIVSAVFLNRGMAVSSLTDSSVYAGGDAVTGAATVIKALGAGRKAATSIDEYIRNKNN